MAKLPNYYKVSVDGLMIKLDPIYEELAEVVRCKDCEHWKDGVAGCTDNVKCCEIGFYMVGENGYCVYGERKA